MPLRYPNYGVRMLRYLMIYINSVFGYLFIKSVIHLVIGWQQLLDESDQILSLALPTALYPGLSYSPIWQNPQGFCCHRVGSQRASKGSEIRHQQCLLLFVFKLKIWIWDFSTLVIKRSPAEMVWKAEMLCTWGRGYDWRYQDIYRTDVFLSQQETAMFL